MKRGDRIYYQTHPGGLKYFGNYIGESRDDSKRVSVQLDTHRHMRKDRPDYTWDARREWLYLADYDLGPVD